MLWLLLLLAVRWHSTTTYNSNARQQPLVGRLLLLQPVWRSKFSVALCTHHHHTTVEVRYTKPSPRGWRLSDTSGVLSLPSSDTSPTTLSNNAGRQRFLLLGDFFFFAAKNSSMPKQEFLSRMCKIILVMIYQKMVIDLLEIAQNSNVEFTPLKNLKKVTHLNIIHFVSNFFEPRVVVKNNGKSREDHF